MRFASLRFVPGKDRFDDPFDFFVGQLTIHRKREASGRGTLRVYERARNARSAPPRVSLLLVNGFFVPIAEEYIWRGLVQVRLMRILPNPFAIGLTAILFSLKHVVVDASLGRFLALIAFGVICGVVAARSTWRRSAALHMVVNLIATLMGLIFGLN